MITKAELDKMVDDEALNQFPPRNDFTSASRLGFKSGASFVTGIIMDEIERLERELILSKVRENDTKPAVSKEMETLRSFVLGKQIQSLKDENGRMREVLGWISKLGEEFGELASAKVAREALTQKAEE